MEKKRYQLPCVAAVKTVGFKLLAETVTRIDGTEEDIEYGGPGAGAGCIKERDPWKEGIWTEDLPMEKDNGIVESLW